MFGDVTHGIDGVCSKGRVLGGISRGWSCLYLKHLSPKLVHTRHHVPFPCCFFQRTEGLWTCGPGHDRLISLAYHLLKGPLHQVGKGPIRPQNAMALIDEYNRILHRIKSSLPVTLRLFHDMEQLRVGKSQAGVAGKSAEAVGMRRGIETRR